MEYSREAENKHSIRRTPDKMRDASKLARTGTNAPEQQARKILLVFTKELRSLASSKLRSRFGLHHVVPEHAHNDHMPDPEILGYI